MSTPQYPPMKSHTPANDSLRAATTALATGGSSAPKNAARQGVLSALCSDSRQTHRPDATHGRRATA